MQKEKKEAIITYFPSDLDKKEIEIRQDKKICTFLSLDEKENYFFSCNNKVEPFLIDSVPI